MILSFMSISPFMEEICILSLSLSHNSLDFCLHETFSIFAHLKYSTNVFLLASVSSFERMNSLSFVP